MRAPFKGLVAPYSERKAIRPGISASAKRISLRPHSARLMSFTLFFRLKSMEVSVFIFKKGFKEFKIKIQKSKDVSCKCGGYFLLFTVAASLVPQSYDY